jgi:hypothetical protein
MTLHTSVFAPAVTGQVTTPTNEPSVSDVEKNHRVQLPLAEGMLDEEASERWFDAFQPFEDTMYARVVKLPWLETKQLRKHRPRAPLGCPKLATRSKAPVTD